MVLQYLRNLRNLVSQPALTNSGQKLSGFLQKQFHEWIEESKVVREKMKDLAKTNYELGLYHYERGNLYDATTRFWIVTLLRPNHYEAYYQHGRCLLARNKPVEAKQSLQKALEIKPDFTEAQYVLATIDGNTDKVTHIPTAIVAELFNKQAATYNDVQIGQKDYKAPATLYETILSLRGDKAQELDILDLGCGTGLCGALFKENNKAKRLVGVDISEAMLIECRKLKSNDRPTYNALKKSDAFSYLQAAEEQFDIIIIAGLLSYVKDVNQLLSLAKKALKPEGIIAFVAEKSEKEGVHLTANAEKYVYSRSYLSQLGTQAGMKEVSFKEAPLYENSTGLYFFFTI